MKDQEPGEPLAIPVADHTNTNTTKSSSSSSPGAVETPSSVCDNSEPNELSNAALPYSIVRVKHKSIRTILGSIDRVSILFGVQYMFISDGYDECGSQSDEQTVFMYFQPIKPTKTASSDNKAEDLSKNLQNYIDNLLAAEAEDSSYDSECDADDSLHAHEHVARTVSDTLGQEFLEYVNEAASQPPPMTSNLQVQQYDRSPNYTQRVEFALKLGYTERLVQAALARLGPNPAQNELLAELIKLGAQQGNRPDLCDSTSIEYTNGSDAGTTVNGGSNGNQSCPFLASAGITIGNGKGDDDSRSNGLRPIVIDGSNVAISHGNKEVFSCLGIRLCVEWFRNRGHKEITVFVPKFRKESPRPDNPIKDQEILFELEKERMLVYTPSRFVGGKRVVCYDDRYVLKLAHENDGIVVSNDNYRDLASENCEYKKVVEERVLMYSFVNDRFMPPDDPLGRSGPTLDNFLRIQPKKGDPLPSCPYGKKCTYGNKCKFYHPERGMGPHKSVTERLSEHAARHLSARNLECQSKTVVCGKSLSVPLSCSSTSNGTDAPLSSEQRRKPLARTRSYAPDACNTLANTEMGTSRSRYELTAGNQSHNNAAQWDDYCNQLSDTINAFPNACSIDNISSQDLRSGVGQSMPAANRDEQNTHLKLRRQLSVNPNGCDARLFRRQNAIKHKPSMNASQLQQQQQHQQQPQQQQQQQLLTPNLNSGHRPLAQALSGPRTLNTNHWELHKNVTRLSSAPDSSRSWQNMQSNSSAEPPNLWLQQPTTNSAVQPLSNTQANRHRIQYHLSSIFPEDQVLAVMGLYPEETNPQNLCAAILNMFPKI